MANAVRIKYRPSAFREMRTLPKVQDSLRSAAERIAEFGGEGFRVGEVRITGGRGRAHATVAAYTYLAQRKNAKHHTLMNGLSQARIG